MQTAVLKYLILAVLCWTFCWQESHSRVLNKDTETLTSKLGHVQRDIHNVRGHWAQTRKEHNESMSVDEQDAILFQYLIVNMIQSVQQSISIVSHLIRICGDTFAGVLSGMVKATGGLLSLASKVFLYLSAQLDLAQLHSPAFLGNLTSRCAYGLRSAAPVLHYAGEACIYSGEILESLTLGLGEAVQDSFWGLEVVSNSSNVIVQFLLQIPTDDGVGGEGVNVGGRLGWYENMTDIAPQTATKESGALHTTSQRHLGSAHSKVNILHPHPHTAEPVTHLVDPNKQHRSAIEIKLGKEWIAPGTATISVHSKDNTHSTHNEHATYDTNSTQSTHNADIHHNTLHIPHLHINNTVFNATGIVYKAQRVWSSIINTTSNVIKHYTTNTTTDTDDAIDSDTDTSSIDDIHTGSIVNESLVHNVTRYIQYYTHYTIHELPPLFDAYAQYTLQLSYTILHALLTLAQHLYTTIVQSQHTEASQGMFFALALVATYILSILPFRSKRAKLLTIVVFGVVVYCSFITTEQIQRDRLVHTTSVQSAHSLLLQQAHQRSRRSGALYSDVAYDDVYSSNGVYSDEYKDISEVSSVGSVGGVQNDDIVTSPHYEHTPTQDVYSNINHHNTVHAHESSANNTANTNATANSTSTSTNTDNTTTLLFDDAVWLNTLLTSLWTIHSTDTTTPTTPTTPTTHPTHTPSTTHATLAHTTPTYSTHGLGAYISEMYLEMINTELSNIPPSVADVRVKKFDLGRAPPLFRGVRVYRVRDHVCMRNEVYGSVGGSGDSNSGSGDVDTSIDKNSGSSASSSASSGSNSVLAHESFLTNLWHSIEKHATGGSADSTAGSGGNAGSDSSSSSTSTGSDSGTSSTSSGSTTSSDDTTTDTSTTTTTTPAHTTPTTTTTPANKHLLAQFSASCDHLILEFDTLYLSDRLNVELTLRKELRSVVPEVSATLTEVSLAGQLRLKVRLTPDYPFVGDGQLSFLSAPQLGFSLSSLGGIELSSVPYAFHWVNTSMHYVLEQYTAPHYMELDLRSTLCPSCDQPPAAHLDLLKLLRAGAGAVLEGVKGRAGQLKRAWCRARIVGHIWSAKAHSLLQHLHRHYLNGVQHVQQAIDKNNPHHRGSGGGSGGNAGGEEDALHYSRYKTFDQVEEWHVHPEVEKQRSGVGGGGLLSKVACLWESGKAELKQKLGRRKVVRPGDMSSADSTGVSASAGGDYTGDSVNSGAIISGGSASGASGTGGDDRNLAGTDLDWMDDVWFT